MEACANVEGMTKQQCVQNDLGDGNFANYATPSMQYTTNTAPPSARKMSSKSAYHSYSLAAVWVYLDVIHQ